MTHLRAESFNLHQFIRTPIHATASSSHFILCSKSLVVGLPPHILSSPVGPCKGLSVPSQPCFLVLPAMAIPTMSNSLSSPHVYICHTLSPECLSYTFPAW